MTTQQCIGWPLVEAELALKQHGLPYQVRRTQSGRHGCDATKRTPRVLAVQGDTLIVAAFWDKLKESAHDDN